MNKRVLFFSVLGGAGSCIWIYSYFLYPSFPSQPGFLVVLAFAAFAFSSLLIYFLTQGVLLPRWQGLSRPWRWGFSIASILFGITLYVATVNFKYAATRSIAFLLPAAGSSPKIPFYAGWLIPAILMIGVYIFASAVIFAFASSFKGISAAPSKLAPWKELLLYALPMMLAWGFYLLVFFPGRIGPDSITQWEQMVTWQFIDWHPPIHTLTYWLITRIWYSPAAIAVVQIISLALTVAWGLVTLRRTGAPTWLTWISVALFALLPANGLLSITLWKDVLFSTAVLALSVIILNIWITGGSWLDKKFAWIGMAVILALVSLYRQNGLMVSLSVLPIIAFIYRKSWKAYLKAAILFIALFVIVKVPLYRALDVAPDTFHVRLPLTFANLIDAHINANTYFSKSEQEILHTTYLDRPMQYVCYRNSDLVLDQVTDRNPLAEQTNALITMAIQLTLRAPLVTIDHFACNGDFAYRIFNRYPWYETVPNLRVWANVYNLKLHSLLPKLARPLDNFVQSLAKNDNLSWFFWRMPFWMYLSLGGCIVFCLRQRTARPLLVLLPGILATVPLLVLSMGQIYRYVYSMVLCGLLISGYFWICAFPQKDEKPGSASVEMVQKRPE